MIRWGRLDIAETLDELVEPETTALIMWDFVERVVSHSFNREEFLARSARLVNAARDAGVTVFYTRLGRGGWEDIGPGMIRMRMKQMNIKPPAENAPPAKNAPETKFAAEVEPHPEDIEFDKFLPNGFLGTNLDWYLRSRGIKTIVLAGITVETGVDGTAREAVNRGYYTVIVRDAVSSLDEASFQDAMKVIERLHDVFDSEELINAWAR
jgi:nicotinamidase-related amidase